MTRQWNEDGTQVPRMARGWHEDPRLTPSPESDEALYWVLVSEPGFFKVLAHFPGNRILLPEMKPRNSIVY